jgi:hypothetical protein
LAASDDAAISIVGLTKKFGSQAVWETPLLLDWLVLDYNKPTSRFRVGRIISEPRAPPRSYHTPRRTIDATGNAPYQPVLDFRC